MSKLPTYQIEELLNEEITYLSSGQATFDDFWATCTKTPEINKTLTLSKQGIDLAVIAKRKGNLKEASKLYSTAFKLRPKYDSTVAWGWMKIFLLAKDWDNAKRILLFHDAIMAAWNQLKQANGDVNFFQECKDCGFTPFFDFSDHTNITLRERSHSSLASRAETQARFCSYGGSDYWDWNYSLTEQDFQDFLKVFPLPF